MKKYMMICFLFIILIFISSFVYADDTLVYIDKNNIDTKYHRVTCSHISPNNYQTISVEDAFNKGYRRCPDCSPPLSDTEKTEREKEFDEMFGNMNPTYTNNISTADNRYVYVTNRGSKFHSPGCDDLDSTPHKMTLAQAQDKGYSPCKKCNPYGLAGNEKNSSNSFLFIGISFIFIVLVIYIIINEKRYEKNRS